MALYDLTPQYFQQVKRVSRSPMWLTIKTSPAHATIRIMDIVPKYQDGMELESGPHEIAISADNNLKYRKWHQIPQGRWTLSVDLIDRTAQLNPEKVRSNPQVETANSGRRGINRALMEWVNNQATPLIIVLIISFLLVFFGWIFLSKRHQRLLAEQRTTSSGNESLLSYGAKPSMHSDIYSSELMMVMWAALLFGAAGMVGFYLMQFIN